MTDVEIVSIGDELLRGIVQETNAHWLSKRIAARGATLRRVVLVPDDVEVIAAELRAVLARAPALVVTHGGLGPTDDDRTREAIARALDLPLEHHAGARAIVHRRFSELAASGAVGDAALTEPRARMAILPRGAIALDNEVGTAPGVLIRYDATTIVALPGVPPELSWIWEHPLAPILDELLGPGGFAEQTMTLDLRDESVVAAMLQRIQAAHEGVYVKSRARGYDEADHIRVTLAATGPSTGDAADAVARAERDVRAALRDASITVLGDAPDA